MRRVMEVLLALSVAGGCSSVPAQTPSPDDFPLKTPPKAGDWLYSREESGQTVKAYMDECLNRKRDGRETILIQPMGRILDSNGDVLETVRDYVGLYYHCTAEVASAIEMSSDAWVESRRQYDADRILIDLRNRIEGRVLAYVGFCKEDLFSEGLNYVFGSGSLQQRVGIYSLARYGAREAVENGEPVFLKRTLKVASHEIGHLLGMPHCIRYECDMNGWNSLSELDRGPMYLCPECLEKARWNTGFEPKARYEKLAVFYEKAGWKADAAFARRQAGRPGTER